jgi:hypothetical protein
VFNRAQHYKHESINLQNMRLYSSGALLNALYCRITAGPGVLTSMSDMQPGHCMIVLGLAGMGLVTVSHCMGSATLQRPDFSVTVSGHITCRHRTGSCMRLVNKQLLFAAHQLRPANM